MSDHSSSSTYGVLIISHGSRSADWVRLVDDAVAAVQAPYGVPVFASYLELVDGRLIQDGITALEEQGVTDIAVVPLFLSSGSTHLDEIRYALGLQAEPMLPTELEPFRVRAKLHWGWPIDDDPDTASLIYANIAPLSANPAEDAVLVVGHGSVEPGFHEKWQQGLNLLAERICALGGYREAGTAMLLPDQLKQRMEQLQSRNPEAAVVIAPFFLSEGYFTRNVIPSRLQGFDYRYNGRALLPSPLVSRWMEKQIAALLTSAGAPNYERTGD
ncbi:sirohydrochlorin chelatase [Paenibacillus contaminans]|uniref:Cobalamin biosynthesis protein CbiX n=1 Tax=Paenibacillus contaminans TaxID=450362 RepID=A0A329M6A2_9BACL|nr:CbiX/SirB N-terminal domain-containing protein [Paenibacillus contaminans]RAV14193.1 cobalamin biosynthesis protein CbiX [Paenibacillus contaminans]